MATPAGGLPGCPGGPALGAVPLPAYAAAAPYPAVPREERLRAAASLGQLEQVIGLISTGTAITPDAEGRTALHLASAGGHAEVVAALLSAGCPVNSAEKSGHTPLQRAAAEGHVDVLQRLLQQRSDVDRQDEINGNGALHEAAWKGYSQSVDLLLKARANMYLRNRGGFTPLHLACQNGHNQTCRLLLLAGCSPDIRNSYGDTPLHTSARYGHAGVMRILISGDASLSEQNKNGDTALHIAAAMGRRKLTRILLDGGVDHALRNKQEETALEIALRKEHSEIVEMLRSPPEVTRTPGRREEKRPKAESGSSSKEGSGKHIDKKKKSTKVHFEPKKCAKGKRHNPQWSPYGCFYPPDTTEFPQPRLDTLPKDPLRKGEQYYLDLSGNIRKGPVGEGYTCYCAPFFRHVEDKLDKDKHELIHHIDLTHGKLDKKIASLEKRTRTQLTGINELMRDRFSHERRECAERAERAAQRARCDLERRQGSQIRGVKDDLTAYLEGRLSALQMRESAVRRSGHHLSRSRSEELLTDLSDEDAASAAAEAPRPLRVVERPPEQRRGRTDQEAADQTQLTNGAVARYQPVAVRPAEHAPRPPQAVLEVRNAQLRAGPPWPGDSRLPPGYVGGPPADTAPPGYNNPNYVQYERVSAGGVQFRPLEPDEAPDQHNDSGYSTRIYGSSQGPSPALSGLPEDDHHPQRHPQTAPHLQQQQQPQPPGRPAPGPRVQALQAQLSRTVEEPPPGIKSSLV